jgi:DNA primase
MLKGRIAIPLRNPKGELVGYAGRVTKDEEISERHPKYLFPGERLKDAVKIEFRKSLLLYNADRIKAPVDNLIVVEGFSATWWLWQAEYRNVVGLMGASCSVEQGKLILNLVKPSGCVWLMPDGDAAGLQCALSIFEQVGAHQWNSSSMMCTILSRPDDGNGRHQLIMLNNFSCKLYHQAPRLIESDSLP